MFKDESGEIVPAIVSEELWDAANAVLSRRSKDVKRRQNLCNHGNLLTGKLYCGCCGAPYYRRDAKDRRGRSNSKWVCSGKLKNGAAACPAVPLYEQELKAVLADVFRDTRPVADARAARYTQMYQALAAAPGGQAEAARLQSAIDHVHRKKRKLLDYNAAGQITDRDFLTMTAECNRELETLTQQQNALAQPPGSRQEFDRHLDQLNTALRQAQAAIETEAIGKAFVEKFISKITATPAGGTIQLEIRLFSGKVTTKYLQALSKRAQTDAPPQVRPGHMCKKMIEAYERSMH